MAKLEFTAELEASLKKEPDPLSVVVHISSAIQESLEKKALLDVESIAVVSRVVAVLLHRKDLSNDVAERVSEFFAKTVEFAVVHLQTDAQVVVGMLLNYFATNSNEFFSQYGLGESVSGKHHDFVQRQKQGSPFLNEELFAPKGKAVRLSVYFLEIVYLFCDLGGLEAVLKRITCLDASKPDLNVVRSYLFMLCRICPLLSHIYQTEIASESKKAFQTYVLNLSNDKLKKLDKSLLNETQKQLHSLLTNTRTTIEADEEIEKLELHVAMKLLQCPFLQQRLAGLNDLRTAVDKVQTAARLAQEHSRAKRSPSALPTNEGDRKRIRYEVPSQTQSQLELEKLEKARYPESSGSEEAERSDEEMEMIDPSDSENVGQLTNRVEDPGREKIVMNKRPNSVGSGIEETLMLAKKQRTINLDEAIELSNSMVDDELSSEDILEHQSIGPMVQSAHMDLSELAFAPTRLTESYLANWLTENEFIKFLLSPGYLHSELLRRCGKICCFLAEQQRLTTKEIDMLWEIASAKSGMGVHESVKDSCYSILEDICGKLYHDLQNYLWHKVKVIPHSSHDERTIAFLRKYTLNTVNVDVAMRADAQSVSPEKTGDNDVASTQSPAGEGNMTTVSPGPSVTVKGEELLLLWDLAINSGNEEVAPQVRVKSLEYLSELIVCPVFGEVQGEVLQKCLDNLVIPHAIPQSYSIFRTIVSKTPSFSKLQTGLRIQPIQFGDATVSGESSVDFEDRLLDVVVKEIEHFCKTAEVGRPARSTTAAMEIEAEIPESSVVELSIAREDPNEESASLLRQIKQSAKLEEGAHGSPFLHDLNSRLSFLRFLIRGRVAHGMKLGAVERIWKSTVLSDLPGVVTDAVLLWLRDAHQENTDVFFRKEDNVPQRLLTALLPQVPIMNLRPSTFLFFKYFFFLVNADEKRLVQIKQVAPTTAAVHSPLPQPEEQTTLSVSTISLRGFGLLWSMALESKDHSVAQRAVNCLTLLYENLEETRMDQDGESACETDNQSIVQGFKGGSIRVSSGGFVAEALAQLKRALEIQKSTYPNLYRDRVGRCLSVLIGLLDSHRRAVKHSMLTRSHYAMTLADSSCQCEEFMVNQPDKTTTLCIYCHANQFEVPQAAAQSADLSVVQTKEVTRSATLGEVRRMIKKTFRLEEDFEIDHGLNSLANVDDMVLLDELHFDRVESLFVRRKGCTANVLQRVYANSEEAKWSGVSDIGLLLLSENMSLLFQIVTSESSLQGTAVSKRYVHEVPEIGRFNGNGECRAWSLLMSLPTDVSRLRNIRFLVKPWDTLLDSTSVYELMYSLQVMRSFLRRAQDWKSYCWSLVALQKGCFAYLLRLLLDPEGIRVLGRGNALGRQCSSLLLEIIHALVERHRFTPIVEAVLCEKGMEVIYCLLARIESLCLENVEDAAVVVADTRFVRDATYLIAWISFFLDQKKSTEEVVSKASMTMQEILFSDKFHLGEFVKNCLLRCRHEKIRGIISQGFKQLLRHISTSLIFFQILSSLGKYVSCHPALIANSGEYFELVESLVVETISRNEVECYEWMYKYAKTLAKLITNHEMYEGRELLFKDRQASQDKVLCGFMNVLKQLLQNMRGKGVTEVKIFIGEKTGLLHHLFQACLFDIPTDDNHGPRAPPKCKSRGSRKAALLLLIELCTNCASNLDAVLQEVAKQHRQSPLVPLLMKGWIEPDAFALSQALLHQHTVADVDLEGALTELERSWQFDPIMNGRAACGYVGLRNLGCICYMNSLLQQLYMIPHFRLSMLQVDTTQCETIEDGSDDDDAGARLEQVQLLQELQKAFCYLHESERKYYDMVSLCSNAKALNAGKALDVYQQQDVDEFFNVLMDQLDSALSKTEKKTLLKELFGGMLCNEIKCKEGCTHTSRREDEFMVLQLDVKGKRSIMESLDSYVQGEMLEGDNKYLCGHCNNKRDAQKRTYLVQLPQVLILHLKRFEFDLEQLRKIKVNDFCEFPLDLNMKPFTREGLEGTTQEDRSEGYYEYTLVGVLVHSGNADCGHYYSYIKDRNSTRAGTDTPESRHENAKWIWFNDEQVSEFNAANLAAMCFGGEENVSASNGMKVKGEMETGGLKVYNAYLLIYERVEFSTAQSSLVRPALNAGNANLEAYYRRCWQENGELLHNQALCEPSYAPFVLALGSVSFKENVHVKQSVAVVLRYVFGTLIHAKNKEKLEDCLETLDELMHSSKEVPRLCLDLLEANGGTWIVQVLLLCTVKDTRERLFQWLEGVIKVVLADERQMYYQVDDDLAKHMLANLALLDDDTVLSSEDLDVEEEVEGDVDIDASKLMLNCFSFMRNKIPWLSDDEKRLLQSKCSQHIRAVPFDLAHQAGEMQDLGEELWNRCLGVPSVWPVRSTLARLIGWMLAMLAEADVHWKHYREFFMMLDRIAAFGNEEAYLMISLGAIPRLLDFILCDESPSLTVLTRVRAKRLQKRVPIGDQASQPHLNFAVRLLSRLLQHCKVPADHEDSSTVPSGLGPRASLASPVQYTLGPLELLLLLKQPAFKRILDQGLDGCRMDALCQHLARERWDTSQLLIEALCNGINEFMETSFEPLFSMINHILQVKDRYHERRVAFAMKLLLSVIRQNHQFPTATYVSIKHLRRFVANPALAKVKAYLCSCDTSWVKHWLLDSTYAKVRHECEGLVNDICDLQTEESTGRSVDTTRNSPSNTSSTAASTAGTSSEHSAERASFFEVLLEMYDQPSTQEIWLSQDYASTLSSPLKSTTSPLALPTGFEKGPLNERLPFLQRNGNSSREILIEPNCFRLASFFRVLARFVQRVENIEAFTADHLKTLVDALICIEQHQVECDYNKGELIRLLLEVIRRDVKYIRFLLENEKFNRTLRLTMVVRQLEEHRRYNNWYATAYYYYFRELIVQPISREKTLCAAYNERHLHWAFRLFLLYNSEVVRTAEPLRDVIRYCYQYSFSWRSNGLSEMLCNIGAHYLTQFGVLNRVHILKVALGSLDRQRRETNIKSGDDLKALKIFIEANGLVFVTHLIIVNIAGCPLGDQSFREDFRLARVMEVSVDILCIVHTALAYLVRNAKAKDDTWGTIDNDVKRRRDDREVQNAIQMWSNMTHLVDVAVKIAFDTGHGQNLSRLHRDAKYHSCCILKLLAQLKE